MAQSDSYFVDDQARSDRIRRIADDCLMRRAAGEEISDESIIEAHPDLMPELEKWLRAVGLLQAAEWQTDEDQLRTAAFSDPAIQRGTQIGPYKMLSILGEGGCGMVYLAESERPIKRRVALKVIKPGMDSNQVLARFEAERQALAVMDHPGVAKVFDAGMTDARRPYFVMEFVKGVPITDHCDRHRLEIKERMGLFIAVCHAVQHAHQKGVIHRDIKPTNLLVNVDGNQELPKVIDFGLAKAMYGPLTDRSLYTQQGQIIGTPAYMSPEQAEVTAQDIDTRADVYSLGVVLYELLTGVLPFELTSGSDEQLRRAIREHDPSTPSTRLATLSADKLTHVTQSRRVEPRQLKRELKGDLDWIVLKCLEKDRKRRYETANGLAMDVRRYLDKEPVLARPPSTRYRFSKLAHRNKAAFVATVAVFLALIGGLSVATWGLANADLARKKLERQNYLVHLAAANQALLSDKYGLARIELSACPENHRGWEWRLLRNRLLSEFMPIEGSGQPIFTRDGQRLISIGPWGTAQDQENSVHIWDLVAADGPTRIGNLKHDTRLYDFALSPDEKRVAAGDYLGHVIVWEIETEEKVWAFKRHDKRIDGIDFSADGRLIATVSHDGRLKVMNASEGAECYSISFDQRLNELQSIQMDSHLRRVEFSPDKNSRWIATSIHHVEAVLIDRMSVEFSSNSSSDGDGPNVSIERLIANGDAIKFPGDGHMLPTFSPADEHLVATAKENLITLWNWDGKELRQAKEPIETNDTALWALAFSADGARLASGHVVSGVNVWDVATRNELASLPDTRDFPRWLSFRPQHNQIAFASMADSLQLWSYAKSRETIRPFAREIPIEVVRFNPNGNRILVGVANGYVVGFGINSKFHHESEKEIADVSHSIVIVDADTGNILRRIEGWFEGGIWVSDGMRIAASKNIGTRSEPSFAIHQIDMEKDTRITRSPSDGKRALLFDIPSTQHLISVSSSGLVNRFDLRFGHHIATKYWTDAGRKLSAANVSSNGKYLALAFYREFEVEIWDIQAETRKEPVKISVPGYVVRLEFTLDERHLFVGSNGGMLALYDIEEDEEPGQPMKSFIGHRLSVTAVAANPQETKIVAADRSGQVIVWDLESSRPLVTLANDDVAILSIDWSPDGNRIVAGKADGTVQIWELPQRP